MTRPPPPPLATDLRLGPQVPRRGNLLSRGFGHLVLRLLGWRLQGSIPDAPRMVLIGAPHTSNMDAVIAFAILMALGLKASTMVKDSAFHGIAGVLLRWFGAVPINRQSPKGVIEQTVDAFRTHRQFVLLLAPEGTRTAAPLWKRGFYHVAQGAKVPVVSAAIDYERKVVSFGGALVPSGDYEADLARILQFVADHSEPRHPERLSKPLCDLQQRPWSRRTSADED